MQGNNQLAQSSSFRKTPAYTNAVVADREKSIDPSKDYVFISGFLSQGNSNDSIALNVGGIDPHDFLVDSGATCNVVDKSTWGGLKVNELMQVRENQQKHYVLMAALILYLRKKRLQLMLLQELLINHVWLILLLLMSRAIICCAVTLLEIWGCCTLGR